MDKNLHNIDKIINDKFNNYLENPSDNVWANLQKKIDNNNFIKVNQKNKFQKRIIALLLLLLGITSTFYLYKSLTNKPDMQNVSTEKIINEMPKAISENKSKNSNDKNSVTNNDNNSIENTKIISNKNININLPITNKNIEFIEKNNQVNANEINNKLDIENETKIIIEKRNKLKENRKFNIKLNKYKKDINLFKNINELQNDLFSIPTTEVGNTFNSLKELSEISNAFLYKNYTSFENKLSNKLLLPILVQNNNLFQKKSNFSVMPFYNNNFYNNDIKEGERRDINDNDNFNNIRNRESHRGNKPSMHQQSFGLLLSYTFKNNFELSTGIGFTNFKNEVNSHTIYGRQNPINGKNGFKLNCAAGTVYLDSKIISSSILNDSVITDATNINLQYFNIPLILGYKYSLNKLSISPIIGLQTNFLSQGKLTTNISKGINKENITSNNIEGLKSIYFNSIIGVKMDYKLLNNLSISIMPTINKGLNSINENTPAKTSYNGYGIATGLKFSF